MSDDLRHVLGAHIEGRIAGPTTPPGHHLPVAGAQGTRPAPPDPLEAQVQTPLAKGIRAAIGLGGRWTANDEREWVRTNGGW